MAEYGWVNVYRPNSGYVPFFIWKSREEAGRAYEQSGTAVIRTDRYRVEERDGTRVLVYDPEPKYEQRDSLLVDEIRKNHFSSFALSHQQAAELVAKHRQQAT